MCKESTKEIATSPASIQRASSLSSSSQEDCSDTTLKHVRGGGSGHKQLTSSRSQSSNNTISKVFAGISLGAGMLGFALWFPFVSVPDASTKTYEFAFFSYDPARTHFDNSPWTYYTDYMLAVVMAAISWIIWKASSPSVNNRKKRTEPLGVRAASLLILYMISVIMGGLCHQTYKTVESRNTASFRILWTVCVGTVSLANTSMGLCGSEIVSKFQRERRCSSMFDKIPLVPQTVWWVYGLCVTAFTAWGGMSFQRPACDIFIAGVTQTPPTFYLVIIFCLLDYPKVKLSMRLLGMSGFIMNAPLLPMYPLLIQYTDWTLASVNTLLHFWLTVTWSIQGCSMLHVIRSTSTAANNNNQVKKNL